MRPLCVWTSRDGLQHFGAVPKARRIPERDVLVEADGLIKPATRLQVGTGAFPHSSIGTSGKWSTHIWYMLVTLEVSHFEMSPLKLVA